jgi:hypothetical protein
MVGAGAAAADDEDDDDDDDDDDDASAADFFAISAKDCHRVCQMCVRNGQSRRRTNPPVFPHADIVSSIDSLSRFHFFL